MSAFTAGGPDHGREEPGNGFAWLKGLLPWLAGVGVAALIGIGTMQQQVSGKASIEDIATLRTEVAGIQRERQQRRDEFRTWQDKTDDRLDGIAERLSGIEALLKARLP